MGFILKLQGVVGEISREWRSVSMPVILKWGIKLLVLLRYTLMLRLQTSFPGKDLVYRTV